MAIVLWMNILHIEAWMQLAKQVLTIWLWIVLICSRKCIHLYFNICEYQYYFIKWINPSKHQILRKYIVYTIIFMHNTINFLSECITFQTMKPNFKWLNINIIWYTILLARHVTKAINIFIKLVWQLCNGFVWYLMKMFVHSTS